MSEIENNETSNPCDPDDVACQTEVLEKLKQFQGITADSVFLEKYPQLEGLEEQVAEDVRNQEEVVKQSIDACAIQEDQAEPMLAPAVEEEVAQGA